MLRRNIVALIGLLAVINRSKWLFDGKRLPTLVLGDIDILYEHAHNKLQTSYSSLEL